MAFFTEKETESWLEPETRPMLMPDGSRKPVTSFRVTWAAQDFLDECTDVTEEEVRDIAVSHARDSGRAYEDAYFDIIGYLHKSIRKRYGIDE